MNNIGIKRKIVLRNAGAKDALPIARLLSEAYTSLDSSVSDSAKVFHSEVERGYHYIVAELDGEIVGLSAWFYHGLPKHGLIEIDRYAIRSDLRRQGIGKKIFQFLLSDADNFFAGFGGLRKVFLFTREENKNAHKFYESLGFMLEGKVKKHFYDIKDDRIYSYFMGDTRKS